MAFLLQMAGFPASGKSTLSLEISKHIHSVVLDRDIIKNAMLSSGIEGQVLASGSYQVVFDLAAYYLKQNINVIIDTPCFYKESVDWGLNICSEMGHDYRYIECIVESYELIDQRLKNRRRLETQISHTTEEQYRAAYKKSVKPEGIGSLTVDTSEQSYNMDHIISYLR